MDAFTAAYVQLFSNRLVYPCNSELRKPPTLIRIAQRSNYAYNDCVFPLFTIRKRSFVVDQLPITLVINVALELFFSTLAIRRAWHHAIIRLSLVAVTTGRRKRSFVAPNLLTDRINTPGEQ